MHELILSSTNYSLSLSPLPPATPSLRIGEGEPLGGRRLAGQHLLEELFLVLRPHDCAAQALAGAQQTVVQHAELQPGLGERLSGQVEGQRLVEHRSDGAAKYARLLALDSPSARHQRHLHVRILKHKTALRESTVDITVWCLEIIANGNQFDLYRTLFGLCIFSFR